MCGSFYFYTMSNRVPFQKPYTNPHDLVLQLQQRGTELGDMELLSDDEEAEFMQLSEALDEYGNTYHLYLIRTPYLTCYL